MPEKIVIFWFRRDIRLQDNTGLYHALKSGFKVLPLFIFDKNILKKLPEDDARVSFLYSNVLLLKKELEGMGSSMIVRYGQPVEIWKRLLKKYEIASVYTNHDFEPYARTRYGEVEGVLKSDKIEFKTYKDHVIFEKSEICKKDGTPYVKFTPYRKKWLEKLYRRTDFYVSKKGKRKSISYYLKPYPTEKYFSNFLKIKKLGMLRLENTGHKKSEFEIPSVVVPREKIVKYELTRDYPAENGTSKLSIHFRFGTVSIRDKARMAFKLSSSYMNELIWRDFYAQILWHFPYVVSQPFRAEYANIKWRNNEAEFEKWCAGKTGFPMVDAGMRELNATGYMHNRLRMITASFLTKHLLIDWRRGEQYFASKLLDYDLASNNGGWQWAAGCGTDAAPYFRIFNPEVQQEKFDKNFDYIKKWIPEFGTDEYVSPMVEHQFARERCLNAFKAALEN